MHKDIDSYQINSPKCGRLRAADQRTGQFVYFLNSETALLHELNCFECSEQSDAIGYEVWRIFRPDNALA